MRNQFPVLISVGFLVCLFSLATDSLSDDDWQQWGGPNRDFQVAAQLNESPQFQEIWRRDLGAGYSAILVDEGRLFTMYRDGDSEIVVCLDQATGQTGWKYRYAAPLNKDADPQFGRGPNATPVIADHRLITIGFNGDIHCLDKLSGSIIWKTNLIGNLGGTVVNFGYSPSPIVYGENVILPVGGKGNGIVALKLEDGSIAWAAQDFKNSYVTPVLASVDGLDQMVFVMTDEVIAVNPTNGKLFWRFPLLNQWSTHAFVPVWDDHTKTLFVSSFGQSHALRMSRDGETIGFEKTWSVQKSGIGFTNAVLANGIIYGSTGSSRAPLVTAIELQTGKILWRKRGFADSNYLAIADRLLLLDEQGKLAIGTPTQSGLDIAVEQQVLNSPKAWTVPTMVGNRVYVRDQKEIVAIQVN